MDSPYTPLRGSRVGSQPQGFSLVLGDELAWLTGDAACNGTDPDLFFPDTQVQAAQAKAVCQGCPLIEACLEYAVPRADVYGIWGGTSDAERLDLRRERGIMQAATRPLAECGTEAGARGHHRRGEPRCEPCRAAATLANRQRIEARRAAEQAAA